MKHMTEQDRPIYTEASISQLEIGRLSIECMAYKLGNGDNFSRIITIQSIEHGNVEGWGKTIFKGTLEELIAKVTRGEN